MKSQFIEYENIMNYIVWNMNLKQALNDNYDSNFDMYLFYRDILDPLFSTSKAMNNDIDCITIYTDLDIYPQSTHLRPLDEIKECFWYVDVINKYTPVWITSMEQQTLSLVCQFYEIKEGHTALLKIDLNYASVFSLHSSLYDNSYGLLLTDGKQTPIYQFHTEDMKDSALAPEKLVSSTLEIAMPQKYIIDYVPDIFQDWQLYLYRPVNVITQTTQIITQTTFFIIFICIVFILLISFFFSRAIVSPLEKLTTDMHQVAYGSFDISTTYDSMDEIGRLSKTFHDMVQKINYLINVVQENKIIQQEQEMQVLQSQINPHFLYNSLSLINSRAIINGQDDIAQMALFLSTYYRTTLNKGKPTITVQEELENVRSYINIQLMMHSYSFDVAYHIDEDILSLKIINMLLQPLVENAIFHGIDHSEKQERGLLEIAGFVSDDQLIFQVTDNGNGIPQSILSNILTCNSKGYGIKNVHNRIQFYFGNQYGLHYQSNPEKGTMAEMVLPICNMKS